jgi:hypothetical protein
VLSYTGVNAGTKYARENAPNVTLLRLNPHARAAARRVDGARLGAVARGRLARGAQGAVVEKEVESQRMFRVSAHPPRAAALISVHEKVWRLKSAPFRAL